MCIHIKESSNPKMPIIWADQALLPTGWARNVRIEIQRGRIQTVTTDATPEGYRTAIALPAPVNVHSHAFQRAMAGLTEARGPDPRDTFWTWRQMMYRFLDQLTPEDVEAIAALVQLEMLEAGYATNAEFHYLHHQPDGTPHDNLAEMSERVAAAADRTGIGLCLLPVHYEFGGCDGRALGPGQVRFGNDLHRFQQVHEGAGRALPRLPQDAALGVAPHSLRAVGQADLKAYGSLFPDGPIHMHLAEQTKEVDEVLNHYGARPVAWALDHMGLDGRWCMIHCTRMVPAETERLARSGAVAGLCPITESSLGDGTFDGVRWMAHGGTLAIGSDSNIRISLTEELRTLDYSQRLRDRSRVPFATPEATGGRRLFDAVLAGGAAATQRATGAIAPGLWADMLAVDDTSVHLAGRSGDTLLDTWIFAGDDRLVTDVWSAGRHMVQDGQHIHRTAITDAYRRVMQELKDAL